MMLPAHTRPKCQAMIGARIASVLSMKE